jgi:membrane protease subunit HflK
VAEAEGAGSSASTAPRARQRFALQLAEYRRAPAVTRQRLYLEAMQEVLPKAGRILVVDEQVKGMLPLINFDGGLKPKPGGGE